jgi:hypothetical protein
MVRPALAGARGVSLSMRSEEFPRMILVERVATLKRFFEESSIFPFG